MPYIVGRDIAKDGEQFSCYQETVHDTQAQAIEDYKQRERRGDKKLFIAKMYAIEVKITLVDPVNEDRSNEVI